MKKLVIIVMWVIVFAFAVFVLSGCEATTTGNRVVYGADVQTFTYAYIRLGDKDIVEGYITQWRDYNNSDEVQLLVNGKYYLTHYSNVVMVADPSQGNLHYTDPSLFGGED